ncbi:restriction endonuclease subunit S [Ideonella sp. 4Y16]|uniref:restriction endonuclease subunit S n=1 Tax=Ideonella alba TaxID=2824118 RepID=UPI001B389F24|nr:restriction endonuclease subunit S [Ideonella alba]MBQ0945713.1 restriction endonuclease subunit S [Ideonella alba]
MAESLELLSSAEGGIARLRKLIRDLAVIGRLVEPPSNSPAWTWSTLGVEVLGMDSGWSPSCLDTPSRSTAVWAVLRTTAVQSLRYVPSENKELPAALDPRPEAEVKVGDVLFTRAGPMNRVGISCLVDATRPRLMLSDKIIRFRPRPDRLDGRFTALCLNAGATADYLEAAKSGMAASQVNISQAKLKAAPIPVPPMSEQHRIVAKVDELMALCDRLEARQQDAEATHARLVQALLDSLTQARDADEFHACWQRLAEQFDTVFTTDGSVDSLKQMVMQLGVEGRLCAGGPRSAWQLKTINEFCTVQGGIQKTPLRAPVRHHFPYLRVANVQRGRIDVAQMERYELAPDELERWRLNAGDLLIVEGNGSEAEIGRCAIWQGEVDNCVYQNHLMRVRPTGDDAVEYLALYLNSPVGTAHMRRLAITTSGLFNLSVGKIRSIPVELPPPAEQHRIVAKVTELLALCDQLKARITAARAKHAQLAEALVHTAVQP